MNDALLSVTDLRVHYPVTDRAGNRRLLKAVDGVSFDIGRGRTLALVGESGCGKSTMGYGILGLAPITSGKVVYDGQDLGTLSTAARRALLAREMQIVFQDPAAALNPKMTIAESICEPMRIRGVDAAEQDRRLRRVMDLVGLSTVQAPRLPSQVSGGQRQRVVIARALSLDPKLIVCDEPVSALDVSIRSQVLNILMELQAELGLSYLFISHDLSVVRHIADEVIVMYLGRVMEQGPTDPVFDTPTHPYTEALLSAIPLPDPVAQRARKRIVLQGEIPSPLAAPEGCPFVTRCPISTARCVTERPAFTSSSRGTAFACHERAPS
ncbi:ABC transporter ATP-binding protein [Pseudotabrizicola alkalilacus]|uniref:ATP-binding cassette domain-containing protein n=1 Tax=Pseudotabrizicola alkalilacus TaxID=2305252 RepID=A0A411YWB6_9RHOB|nr:oligopeptide/dipeptide ABC transporter ATP-binding protein [Pseudotabrizicola alkalilacus]RGP35187.1 ATP-binding cassette domain-containing protein [Pseudotabrizicola alkalilacus]